MSNKMMEMNALCLIRTFQVQIQAERRRSDRLQSNLHENRVFWLSSNFCSRFLSLQMITLEKQVDARQRFHETLEMTDAKQMPVIFPYSPQ